MTAERTARSARAPAASCRLRGAVRAGLRRAARAAGAPGARASRQWLRRHDAAPARTWRLLVLSTDRRLPARYARWRTALPSGGDQRLCEHVRARTEPG